MRCYEHTLIARQDLSPQQAQTLAETYSGVLTEHGAEVTKTEYWGLRNLSYRIKKNRKGHYLHLNVRASAAAIAELERQERLSDDVLRYLTVKVDELEEGPSVVMQSRSSREERSRRHEDGDRPRRAYDDEERPRRAHGEGDERPRRAQDEGDERPRRAPEDDERPRRARDDEERPRRSRRDGAARGEDSAEGGEQSPNPAEATAEEEQS